MSLPGSIKLSLGYQSGVYLLTFGTRRRPSTVEGADFMLSRYQASGIVDIDIW
jgi:hypothetical protein